MLSSRNSRITPASRQHRRHARQRVEQAIVGLRGTTTRRRTSPRAHDEIGVEIPVEDAQRRAARSTKISGLNASRAKTTDSSASARVQQAAMRDAAVEPGQRGAFERPADGDPLVLQLQRNRDASRRRATRRPPAPAARGRARLAARGAAAPATAAPAPRLRHRHHADDRRQAALQQRGARRQRSDGAGQRSPSGAGRARRGPPTEDERIGGQHGIERPAPAGSRRTTPPSRRCASCQSPGAYHAGRAAAGATHGQCDARRARGSGRR